MTTVLRHGPDRGASRRLSLAHRPPAPLRASPLVVVRAEALAVRPGFDTVGVVLALVLDALAPAALAVGLPDPVPTQVGTPSPTDGMCALIPLTDGPHCLFLAVGTDNPSALAAAAGLDSADAPDVLAEMANVAAGVVVAGTEYQIGLPVVVDHRPLVAPPADERVFRVGGACLFAGVWG